MEYTDSFIEETQAGLIAGNWYAVYTRSNYEKKVASQFTLRGITTYLPLWQEVHNWSDRRKLVEVPVFRGYVFARFEDSGRNRLSILQTPGVARIVGGCGDIEVIPDAEIHAIRKLLSSDLKCALHPFLREGDKVRVMRGPLEGIEGIFLRHKGAGRLVISVSLISQAVATEIDAQDVTAVGRGIVQPVRIHASKALLEDQGTRSQLPAA